VLCAELVHITAQQLYLNTSAVCHKHGVLSITDITSNGTPVVLKQKSATQFICSSDIHFISEIHGFLCDVLCLIKHHVINEMSGGTAPYNLNVASLMETNDIIAFRVSKPLMAMCYVTNVAEELAASIFRV
jgi:hypothetical protein